MLSGWEGLAAQGRGMALGGSGWGPLACCPVPNPWCLLSSGLTIHQGGARSTRLCRREISVPLDGQSSASYVGACVLPAGGGGGGDK